MQRLVYRSWFFEYHFLHRSAAILFTTQASCCPTPSWRQKKEETFHCLSNLGWTAQVSPRYWWQSELVLNQFRRGVTRLAESAWPGFFLSLFSKLEALKSRPLEREESVLAHESLLKSFQRSDCGASVEAGCCVFPACLGRLQWADNKHCCRLNTPSLLAAQQKRGNRDLKLNLLLIIIIVQLCILERRWKESKTATES